MQSERDCIYILNRCAHYCGRYTSTIQAPLAFLAQSCCEVGLAETLQIAPVLVVSQEWICVSQAPAGFNLKKAWTGAAFLLLFSIALLVKAPAVARANAATGSTCFKMFVLII